EHVMLDTIPRQYGPFTFPCNNVGTDTRFSAIFILAKGVISDVWIDKVIINDITDGAGVVSGVSITPELILTNGQTAGLAKSIMPSNAANQNVNWISSNTAVAEVDEDGHVQALSPGAATITATTEDGGYQSRSIISVLPAGTATNQNGEFDDGMSGWVVYDWTGPNQGNGGNEFSVVQGAGLSGDNALHVDIVNDNAEGWTLQLRQALNFRLEVGRTYEISFMAKAESARQINPLLNASPSNTNYWTGTANLTTSPQTFIYKYTCTNPNVENEESFAFKFYLAKGVESDIWIDNIVVRDLSGGGTNPVLGGRIEAENYDAQSGLSVSGGALGSCDQNDWARYDDIDLTGVKELRVHLASPGSAGNMEVRLGSTAGTLVARMPTVNTGGWTTFKSFTVPVSETTGVHDLFIVFKDRPSGGIMNVDWLEFLGESP